MSRIGKKGIDIPAKTEVKIDGCIVTVKGPLGELKREFKKNISITVVENKVELKPVKISQENNTLWGTVSSHINNMVEGVTNGYTKKLIIEGIGYKADATPTDLTLKVGFSHPVKILIPSDLKLTSEKGLITITGIDKESVNSFAAKIKSVKKPEPYKGKGIRYEGEVIRRKEGKKTA